MLFKDLAVPVFQNFPVVLRQHLLPHILKGVRITWNLSISLLFHIQKSFFSCTSIWGRRICKFLISYSPVYFKMSNCNSFSLLINSSLYLEIFLFLLCLSRVEGGHFFSQNSNLCKLFLSFLPLSLLPFFYLSLPHLSLCCTANQGAFCSD